MVFAGDDKAFNEFVGTYVEIILGMKPDLKKDEEDSDPEDNEEEEYLNHLNRSTRSTAKSSYSKNASSRNSNAYKSVGQLHMKYGVGGSNNY